MLTALTPMHRTTQTNVEGRLDDVPLVAQICPGDSDAAMSCRQQGHGLPRLLRPTMLAAGKQCICMRIRMT